MWVQRYQPHYLYADGDWSGSDDFLRTKEFLAWLFNVAAVKDEVVVNDRWGNETRSKHGCVVRTRSATESDRTANHGERARRVTGKACVMRHAAPRCSQRCARVPEQLSSVGCRRSRHWVWLFARAGCEYKRPLGCVQRHVLVRIRPRLLLREPFVRGDAGVWEEFRVQPQRGHPCRR